MDRQRWAEGETGVELRVNAAFLAALVGVWASLSPEDPAAALEPRTRSDLAILEDSLAHDPHDRATANNLASRYLRLGRPGLAIAALRTVDPALLRDDPLLQHRLASAYEQSGRVLDAFYTSELALSLCGRSVGSAQSSAVTPVPELDCSEREYAMLEMHRSALHHMVRWGVADPSRDTRSRTAYGLAVRTARLASAGPASAEAPSPRTEIVHFLPGVVTTVRATMRSRP